MHKGVKEKARGLSSMMKPIQTFPPARIYIVNDSISECHMMSNSLSQAGYKVEFATNGRDGLYAVLQVPPNCLILNDVLAGTSGFAIARQVRAIPAFQTVPIIIIGIQNTLINQKYAFKMGANSYLAKPFSTEALVQTVKQMVPTSPQPIPSPPSNSQPLARPISQPIARPTHSQPLPPLPPSSFSPEPRQTPSGALAASTLIPYRPNEVDTMLQSNPFARSSIMADKNARRLYALIDGQKNIGTLAEIMQLDLPVTLQLLKTLWKQQHIAFYDEKHHSLKNTAFLEDTNPHTY
jgi:twitching motility two-component system response regulator PilH